MGIIANTPIVFVATTAASTNSHLATIYNTLTCESIASNPLIYATHALTCVDRGAINFNNYAQRA